ncbi:MAG: class I SAM-dependent methyltransferase, partial [Polyangiaceae bacterium]
PSARVIATDIEPDRVRYLEERAQRDRLPNLSALLSTSTASGLAADSVDRILIVHVWHHLANRIAYARDLAAALRAGGKIVIVEFPLSAHRGPPAELRVAPEAIVAELATAGLSAKVSSLSIPDQYIVEAWKPVSPFLSHVGGKPMVEAARR